MKRITGTNWQLCSVFTGIILIIINYLNCTPPQVIQKETPHQSERYISYNSKMVEQEIQRLEKLLEDTTYAEPDSIDTTLADSADTALTKEKIMINLFELSIHRSNPDPDYHKAYAYAALLYNMKTKARLYYLNWGRVLSNHFKLTTEKDSLIQENDSLLMEIENNSKTSTSLRYTLQKHSKQIDSLSVLIKEQNETIEKLKKLDLMMEQQRSKIQ